MNDFHIIDYTNHTSTGGTSGRYFNTGNGHEFYNPSGASKATGQQAWHGNQGGDSIALIFFSPLFGPFFGPLLEIAY